MPTPASSAMNSATPISTDRWDTPVPPEPCEVSLIVIPTARRFVLFGGEEARGLHQLLVPLLFLANPVEVFLAGHESLVERAVAHQLLPLRRLADLLHQLD